MEPFLQQIISNLEAQEPLEHLISRLEEHPSEDVQSILVELNCLALFIKQLRNYLVKLCSSQRFYHKNRHVLNSLLYGLNRTQGQEKYGNCLQQYQDSMDFTYVNCTNPKQELSQQDISKEKYNRLLRKQREHEFIESIKTLSEQLHEQIKIGIDAKEFFKKSLKTINDYLSDGVFPLACFKQKIMPIVDIQNDSYFIKTKNRIPLVLNIGFGKFMYKDDQMLSNQIIAKNIIKFLSDKIECVKIKTYEIIPFSKGALYEFIEGALTVSEIKKLHNKSIKNYFESLNNQVMYKNFCESYAGFCIVQYVLMLTDRHNQNIMITPEGQIFHIDLAYIYEMKVGKVRFQSAPFKFPQQYKHLMGDFKYWQSCLTKGFCSLVKVIPELMVRLRAMMKLKELQCFCGFSLQKYRSRFPSSYESIQKFIQKIIYDSFNVFSTRHYDKYQYTTNDILY